MSKISIITTAYRHEKFISQTLDSIVNQTFSDWELLIGDDSPDNATWDIIQKYIEKYPGKIRAWHHMPSKGIVGNLNFLLEAISKSSEYIAFLEGDDIFLPSYLQKKMEIWGKYPDLGLVYNELSTIDGAGKIIEKRFLGPRTRKWYKNESDTIGNFLTRDMVCFSYSTLMAKRFDGIRVTDLGYDGLMGSESDFWLQIASKSNIYGIEEPLTLYRRHQNNTSKNLKVTIQHFEYFVQKYFLDGFISQKDYAKMQILIRMMKVFHLLQNREYFAAINTGIACLNISFLNTIVIGAQSTYYRLLKPYFYGIYR